MGIFREYVLNIVQKEFFSPKCTKYHFGGQTLPGTTGELTAQAGLREAYFQGKGMRWEGSGENRGRQGREERQGEGDYDYTTHGNHPHIVPAVTEICVVRVENLYVHRQFDTKDLLTLPTINMKTLSFNSNK